jgi:C_GCAxxG_C_C family probable redox protein
MSSVGKKAMKHFDSDYNCTQSVLRAVLEHKGLFLEEFPYLAAGLGGGISHEGNVCGAVTGAILSIGMITSQLALDVKGHKERTYKHSEKFIAKFKEEFDSIICRELTGLDVSNPDDIQRGRETGIFQEKCTKFVERASLLVLEMFPDKPV